MNRKELLAAGGAAAAIAFGWYQFVWQAQGAAATKAEADRTAAVAATTKLEGQVASLERTKAELDQQKATVQAINDAIPDEPDQSALMKLLQARAKEHSIVLVTFTNSQVSKPSAGAASGATAAAGSAPAERANEIALTLSMHGAYENVLQFVNGLSDVPRLIVVDAVTLQSLAAAAKPGEATAAREVSINLTARAFTTAESPTSGGAATGPTTTAATAASGAAGGSAAATTATTAPASGSTATTATKAVP